MSNPTMVIVSDFTLEFKQGKDLFTLGAKKKSICPICGGDLKIVGSRKRKYIQTTGVTCTLVIRRLKCRECKKMHHELPDILVPYKRHCSETIEKVVEEEIITICCETSTIKKIALWFREKVQYFCGCVESIFAGNNSPLNSSSVSLLQKIKILIGIEPTWLKRLARFVVNLNLWVHTRSEYLTD